MGAALDQGTWWFN